MAFDLLAELELLVAELDKRSIEYAVCGGLALAVHGHPRFTQDIDLLVRAEQLDAAAGAARDLGFDVPARKMTFGLRTSTPREVQRLSKIEPETGRLLSLDLLVVAYEFVEVWADRVVIPWRGRDFMIVSREGLVTMKRVAGRPQDLVDIDVLEGRLPQTSGDGDEG